MNTEHAARVINNFSKLVLQATQHPWVRHERDVTLSPRAVDGVDTDICSLTYNDNWLADGDYIAAMAPATGAAFCELLRACVDAGGTTADLANDVLEHLDFAL